MQAANWGETHGITIGPEASRIFAEIVFQHLGLEMESRVRDAGVDRRDFEILRYVDDYFVFAATPMALETVSAIVESTLIEHKFALNTSKTRDYTTPFTTSVSVKKANLKTFLKVSLPLEGDLPLADDREISVHLKSTLIGAEDETAAVGAALSQVERRLVKFLQKRAPKCRNQKDAQLLLDYVWAYVHNMLFQYLSHPSVASAMKVVRALRLYFGAPELFPLTDSERRAIRFRTEEHVNFGIHKAVERLLDVTNAEIELCHFLSLAGACKIRIVTSSRLTEVLMSTFDENVPRPKGNHASLMLTLSIAKYYLSDPTCDALVRRRILKRCEDVAQELLSAGYMPTHRVKAHAMQEVFVLAIATCPYMSTSEKISILDQPWLVALVGAELFKNENAAKASKRFLRDCIAEASLVTSPAEAAPNAFAWNNDRFDAVLYEKQPQFIY
jgi:ribosome-associated translation inhibitor RaiA